MPTGPPLCRRRRRGPHSARSVSASAAMCRRPLLPLLALAALLALPPASHGLSCFQCEDPLPSSDHQHPLLRSTGAGTIQRCTDFEASDNKFKMESCLEDLDKTCAKVSWEGGEKRGCYDNTFEVGCQEEGGYTFCICTGDYCNSAGLTAPALLLLLPAALLAALYTA